MSKISVIIPAYNAEKFIERSLDSVFAQNHSDIEVIVVDDKSTDDTAGKLSTYQSRPGLSFLPLKAERKGVSAARDQGLQAATGDFVLFLDADDWLEPGCLLKMEDIAVSKNMDLVICSFRKVHEGSVDYGATITGIPTGPLNRDFLVAYAQNYLKSPGRWPLLNNVWGRLYRRQTIIDNGVSFDERLTVGEDISFNYSFLKHTDAVWFDETVIYNYFISNNLGSATMGRTVDSIILRHALENIGAFLVSRGIDPVAVDLAIRHARTHLAIVGIVRTSLKAFAVGVIQSYGLVRKVVLDPDLQYAVGGYDPTLANSYLLPALIKKRLPLFVFLVAVTKGIRRYGLMATLRGQA